MASRKAAGFTERIRDSRFSREVVGPKIARPLATWLEDTFVDEDGDTLLENEVALDGRTFRILDNPKRPPAVPATPSLVVEEGR